MYYQFKSFFNFEKDEYNMECCIATHMPTLLKVSYIFNVEYCILYIMVYIYFWNIIH